MRKGEQVHTFSIDRLILKHPKINLMYISLVMTKLNHLTLSISKSKFMIIGSSQRLNKIDSISFKIDNMDLDEVSSFKYLGIVINNRLTWQDHVDQMFSKINKKLGLLKRIRYCLPLDARLLFFNSYVLPLFDYADIVWGIGATPL